MKSLHWSVVALVVLALLGLPVWHNLSGMGAASVPSVEAQTLRSSQGRNVQGGGIRLGK